MYSYRSPRKIMSSHLFDKMTNPLTTYMGQNVMETCTCSCEEMSRDRNKTNIISKDTLCLYLAARFWQVKHNDILKILMTNERNKMNKTLI